MHAVHLIIPPSTNICSKKLNVEKCSFKIEMTFILMLFPTAPELVVRTFLVNKYAFKCVLFHGQIVFDLLPSLCTSALRKSQLKEIQLAETS